MKHRGFSIIEMTVTLVIFGLLLASAMPNLSSWMRNSKLRSQTEALQSGLQRARDEAVRRNRPISLWLVNQTGQTFTSDCTVSSTGVSWIVSATSPNGACDSALLVSSDTASAPRQLVSNSGSLIAVSGFTDNTKATTAYSVTFDGFGRVTTSTTTANNLRRIYIEFATTTDTDRPQRIDINPSGLVRACDVSVTSTSDPRHCPDGE